METKSLQDDLEAFADISYRLLFADGSVQLWSWKEKQRVRYRF